MSALEAILHFHSTGASTVERDLRNIGREAGRTGGAFSKVGGVANAASNGIIVGIAGAAYASVKASAKFQGSLAQIGAATGASRKEVKFLHDQVLALGSQGLAISPQQAAQALYPIESSGYRGAKAIDMLKAAYKGARITGADLTETTSALAGVMNTHFSGIKNSSQAMAIMNAIVGQGNIKMKDLAASLGTGVLSVLKGAGLGLRDFGGYLDLATRHHIPAIQAATRLRFTLSSLESPTKSASKQLATLGMYPSQLADDLRKPNGLILAFKDLNQHMQALGYNKDQVNNVLATLFGRSRGMATAQLIYQNLDQLQQLQGSLPTNKNAQSALQRQFDSVTKTTGYQFDLLKTKAEELAIRIGDRILPEVNKMMPKIGMILTFLGQHVGTLIAIGRDLLIAALAFKAVRLAIKGFNFGKDVAKGVGGLLSRIFGKGGIAGAAEQALKTTMTVAEMTVDVMYVRTMIGGGNGLPGGGKGPHEKVPIETKPRFRERVKTFFRGSPEHPAGFAESFAKTAIKHPVGAAAAIGSLLYGFAQMSKADNTPGAKLGTFAKSAVEFADPTNLANLVGLPSLSQLILGNPVDNAQRLSLARVLSGHPNRQGWNNTQLGAVGGPTGARPDQTSKDFESMNAQLALLEQHKESPTKVAFNLNWLAKQAAKVNDTKWAFADTLAAQMVQGQGVSSKGVQGIVGELGKMSPQARDQAELAMFQMSRGMETAGEVPKGTTQTLVTNLEGKFGGLSTNVQTAIQQMGLKVDPVFDTLKSKTDAAGTSAGQAAAAYQQFSQWVQQTAQNIKNNPVLTISPKGNPLVLPKPKAPKSGQPGFGVIPNNPTNPLSSSPFSQGGVVKHFQAGGATGVDNIPAWLASGEGVVNRRGMSSLNSAGLSAVNSGNPFAQIMVMLQTMERSHQSQMRALMERAQNNQLTIEPSTTVINVDGRRLAESTTHYALKRAARGASSANIGGPLIQGAQI